MAQTLNLKIEKGTTWTLGLAVSIDGLPIDSSWAVSAAVSASKGTPALHTFSTAAGNAVVLDGVLVLSVLPATSAAWNWSGGVYDLYISKAGVVERVFTGLVFVR